MLYELYVYRFPSSQIDAFVIIITNFVNIPYIRYLKVYIFAVKICVSILKT